MKTALFVQDKNLEGNDYFRCDESIVKKDNPCRAKFFSKLAYPKGIHIYKSKDLNIYINLRSVNINTYLSDENRDIKHRLVPVSFFSKFKKPTDAYDEFVKHLSIYGTPVNEDVLEKIEQTLKKQDSKRRVCFIALMAFLVLLAICLLNVSRIDSNKKECQTKDLFINSINSPTYLSDNLITKFSKI